MTQRFYTPEQAAAQNARVARHRGKTLVDAERVDAVPAKAKFGNEKCWHDGIEFDSFAEGEHYLQLKLRQVAKQITDLKCHVPLALSVHGIHIGNYEVDFLYHERGVRVFVDVKGARTDLYKWKKKHAEAQYSITIVEIPA